MFTSRSLRAAVPPGALAVHELRLGDAVRALDVRGTLDAATTAELTGRIDAAAAGGVRWLILDAAGLAAVDDAAVELLLGAGRALRTRGVELVVAGAPPDLAQRFAAVPVAHRPAQVPSLDAAVMLLKRRRPGADGGRSLPRAKQPIAALMLPDIEPGP